MASGFFGAAGGMGYHTGEAFGWSFIGAWMVVPV